MPHSTITQAGDEPHQKVIELQDPWRFVCLAPQHSAQPALWAAAAAPATPVPVQGTDHRHDHRVAELPVRLRVGDGDLEGVRVAHQASALAGRQAPWPGTARPADEDLRAVLVVAGAEGPGRRPPVRPGRSRSRCRPPGASRRSPAGTARGDQSGCTSGRPRLASQDRSERRPRRVRGKLVGNSKRCSP